MSDVTLSMHCSPFTFLQKYIFSSLQLCPMWFLRQNASTSCRGKVMFSHVSVILSTGKAVTPSSSPDFLTRQIGTHPSSPPFLSYSQVSLVPSPPTHPPSQVGRDPPIPYLQELGRRTRQEGGPTLLLLPNPLLFGAAS